MDTWKDELKGRILDVNERIEVAAQKSGRKAEDVRLIAVTKTIPVERINTAISWGIQRIGENRVQELCSKLTDLSPVEKHIIGTLQTNKVKYITDGKVSCIHSLDRLSLAKTLCRQCMESVDVLVQVNIGNEPTKSGVSPEDLLTFLEQLENPMYDKLRIRGLMCIPPAVTGDRVRAFFAQLRTLADEAKKMGLNRERRTFDELSMGMSNDFEDAILEGATYVRVGSAIFGSRRT